MILSHVRPGSTLMLHSSLSRTVSQRGCTPNDVIQAFLDRLGPNGTLVLPLFNFEFTKGSAFDIRSTPSHMGALTEAGRIWPGAVRTGHPIYSFVAIGGRAESFRAVDNYSGYGADSPFGILRDLDGDIGILDLPDQNSMTFYHHVEELNDVPYRFHKAFSGDYTDSSGATSERTYSIFVRDIESGVQTSVDRMGERLWQKNLYRGERPKEGSGLRIINANSLFEEVSLAISAGDASKYLYEIVR